MRSLTILLFFLIAIPGYSREADSTAPVSTIFDAHAYAFDIDMKYAETADLKSSYMKKNLFENTEENYSMLIDAFFNGESIVLVDSYENDNGAISDNEFFFNEGKLTFVVIKLKMPDEEEFITKKCYYFEQMMVLMIDEKGKEHKPESIEFKKVEDMVSWRVTEILDLMNK